MALRYHSDKHRIVADIIPFYDEGNYHVFYLQGFADGTGWTRHNTPWAHIRSRDLVHWETLPTALETGLQNEQDGGACFTGSVIRAGGQVHIFYTGFRPGSSIGREQIMHAVSDDGVHFVKNQDNPVLLLDNTYYGAGEDFRDPFVFWNEEEQLYWMLFTAGDAAPISGVRRGVIGLAVSADLRRWAFRPPIYAPRKYPSLECPDLFRIGDQWYLLFSQFGRTEYRIGDSPGGPWRLPKQPHFDAGDYFFYAAKTFSDGEKRYLLGWCGDLAGGRDAAKALWGGALVTPREIVQEPGGELSLRCPDAFLQPFTDGRGSGYNQLKSVCGEWTLTAGSAEAQADDGFASCLAVAGGGAAVSLRLVLQVSGDNGSAGVLLRSSDDHGQCYAVVVNFAEGTLALERTYSVEAFHGPAHQGIRAICHRTMPAEKNRPVSLEVFLQDDIVEVFAGGVTLTAPVKDIRAGRWGLFASDTRALFSGIQAIEG